MHSLKSSLLHGWTILVFVISLLCPQEKLQAAEPVTSAATLLALQAALQQLDNIIGNAIGTADTAAKNRLEQARAEIGAMLRDLERVQKGLVKDANGLIQEVVRQAHFLSAELKRNFDAAERRVFLDLNSSLAGLSQTLDGFPFAKVAPYVAAIDPPRIRSDSKNKRVTIYGYIPVPADPKRRPSVQIGGQNITLVKEAGGRWAFDMPPEIPLSEESFIPIAITIPKKKFLSWTTELISERIYVERLKPYSATVTYYYPDPDFTANVEADKEFKDDAATQAKSGKEWNNRVISAEDLFIQTVSSSGQFDTKSVRLLDPRGRIEKADACEHARAEGKIDRWNESLISFSLHAPGIGPHMHSHDVEKEIKAFGKVVWRGVVTEHYLFGGAGGWCDIYLRPLFLANRKGKSPTLPGKDVTIVFGKNEAVEAPTPSQPGAAINLRVVNKEIINIPGVRIELPVPQLTIKDAKVPAKAIDPNSPWQVKIQVKFKDGDEKWDADPILLSPAKLDGTTRGVTARFLEGKIYLTAF